MGKAKVTGTRWETAVADYLRGWFPGCERRALRGRNDGGDIAGLPATIECKATRTIDLPQALGEAKQAAARNGGGRYAAVIKRRNHPVGQAYVVLTLEQYAQLLWEWDTGWHRTP